MAPAISISVVIPVHNSAGYLRRCLEALGASSVVPADTIVVDDGSTDNSGDVAREFGATVLTTGRQSGPARARNLGVEVARGEIILFVDADVCVRPDTVGRVQRAFAEDLEMDAVFGSYDDAPASPDFISQYRNLMHAFVHQTARREAGTFWTGCGAIRKAVFEQVGGFDDSFKSIMDIELGYRLKRAGRRIILDRNIQVTHLKRWTFWSMVKTDVFKRGIRWTELILRDRRMPNDLNVSAGQRVSLLLVLFVGLAAVFGTTLWGLAFALPGLALLLTLLSRYWGEQTARGKGWAAVWASVTVIGMSLLAWAAGLGMLAVPLVASLLLMVLAHRLARGLPEWLLAAPVAGALAAAATAWLRLPVAGRWTILGIVAAHLALLALNARFYRFLWSRRGLLFVLAAFPFHLLYYCYSGFAFVAGCFRHLWTANTGGSGAPRDA